MKRTSKIMIGVFILATAILTFETTALAGKLPDNVLLQENGEYRMEIYDIEDGYLQVSFLPELDRHDFQWDKLKLEKNTGFLQYEDSHYPNPQIGIDVSKFQGDIDWKKVSESNIDFAIVRLGYRGYSNGKLMFDPAYGEKYARCVSSGRQNGSVLLFTGNQ